MVKKLWGGRFKKAINRDFEEFSKSVHYDYKLAEYDIYHSLIHTAALIDSGILSKQEGNKLITALRQILCQIEKGDFEPDLDCEDIHSDIQNRVEKKAGALASKLHTLRSRNDQIVFDEKIYCLQAAAALKKILEALFEAVLDKAKEYEKNFFVGYTHLRRAQVVYFSDYILAYAHMFKRDWQRFNCFFKYLDVSIGAGALAGSPLNFKHYEKVVFSALVKKNFEGLANSLDNVSNRDFIIELLSILSMIQMHLSRLAEDFILYSGREFNFLSLPEEFCTGSSLMPHKKNPDFLELVRGYTGTIYGNQMSVLTMMKGLPLTYNRDMQLDKEPLFSSVEIVKKELTIMADFIKGVSLNIEKIDCALQDENLYATEILEFLVMDAGAAFGEAHNIVGRLVSHSEDNKCKIKDMSDEDLKVFHPSLNAPALCKIMNPQYAVSSKQSVSRKFPRLNNGNNK